jgi:hypothetical protein
MAFYEFVVFVIGVDSLALLFLYFKKKQAFGCIKIRQLTENFLFLFFLLIQLDLNIKRCFLNIILIDLLAVLGVGMSLSSTAWA